MGLITSLSLAGIRSTADQLARLRLRIVLAGTYLAFAVILGGPLELGRASAAELTAAVNPQGSYLPHLAFQDGNSFAMAMWPDIEVRAMPEKVPVVGFRSEVQRAYLGSTSVAEDSLEALDINYRGIAGVGGTFHVARQGEFSPEPIILSVDLRVQHAVHDELTKAISRFDAIAAAAAIMDVHTGEIIAMVSLPDFDPNEPGSILAEGRFNRLTAGRYEVGSIFKIVTVAAALESGRVRLNDLVDARHPLRFGRHTISDFRGQHRMLTVREVFTYSSNIGTARLVEQMGRDYFRTFISALGFDTRSAIELPEVTSSYVPEAFSAVGAATASFGHGISLTPIQMLTALGALVNGGYLVQPTLFVRSFEDARQHAPQVVSSHTSVQIIRLLRLNALEGGARRAEHLAPGYRIGGKTGTAEKVVDGRYAKDKNVTFFTSVFPMDAPRYAMLVMLDEPHAEGTSRNRTAGWNAGEVSGKLVSRTAPMLGIAPRF
ncbi:cell division protein FtsI (penicillin-binding protein 3) [Mesorhizobium sp. J18]|uniref:peptidoglycan D,D-transpeptidase FtsI family protein n=1 Tax=Mesorhizobium sp. J18 TaxID=935263 RepID=UPI00119AEDB5|nr:penicillin-binding protein 2 [Mesorhizobium sp. J18]TWG89970.1 cell division protein FtsI (penicillin-binding protein 3) [Mesorhizobium sp. J18]